MFKSFFALILLLCVALPIAAEINLYHSNDPHPSYEITSPFRVDVPENIPSLLTLTGGAFMVFATGEEIQRIEIRRAHDGGQFNLDVYTHPDGRWFGAWGFIFGAPDYENPRDADTNRTRAFDGIYQVSVDIHGTESGRSVDFLFHVQDVEPTYYFQATRQIPLTPLIVGLFLPQTLAIATGEYHVFETPENQLDVIDPNVIYASQVRWQRHTSPVIVQGTQLQALEIVDEGDGDKFTLETVETGDVVGNKKIMGFLRFKEVPDYENPQDADGDNVYLVNMKTTSLEKNHPAPSLYGGVFVSDTSTQLYRVIVTDVADGQTAPPATRPMKLVTTWAGLKKR